VEIGGIPSKGAYLLRSKVAKLPFNGAKFIPVALVRSALCVTETHGAERAGYMQMQVLIPALLARLVTLKRLTRRRRWRSTKQRRPTQHRMRQCASVRMTPSLHRRHTYRLLSKKETAGRSTPARPVLKLQKTCISCIKQPRRAIRLWFACVF